jgi:ribonuclease Z
LHGDHFFGLVGLVSTLPCSTEQLIFTSMVQGLKEIIKLQLRLSNSGQLWLHFHELESNDKSFMKMKSYSKNHSFKAWDIYEWFFVSEEKR